jgi:hypothetical protein
VDCRLPYRPSHCHTGSLADRRSGLCTSWRSDGCVLPQAESRDLATHRPWLGSPRAQPLLSRGRPGNVSGMAQSSGGVGCVCRSIFPPRVSATCWGVGAGLPPNKRLQLTGHSSSQSTVLRSGIVITRFQPAGQRARQLNRRSVRLRYEHHCASTLASDRSLAHDRWCRSCRLGAGRCAVCSRAARCRSATKHASRCYDCYFLQWLREPHPGVARAGESWSRIRRVGARGAQRPP